MSLFEGASTNYRLQHKNLDNDQINRLASELDFLRKRSRHAVRNDGFAAAACAKSVANWIGTGIVGKWDNKQLQKHWLEFCKNPTLDGKGTFSSAQKLIGYSLFQSGEVFLRKRVATKYGKTIPFYIDIIESDYLPVNKLMTDKNIINGISLDKVTRRPTKYHFSKAHPNTTLFTEYYGQTSSVAAKDIIHVFERTRPQQLRGFPLLSPVLVPLLEIQELTEATVIRQKAAQAIAWVVKKNTPSNFNPIGLPTVETDTDPHKQGTPLVKKVISEITAGGVHYLEQDEDLIVTEPPDIGANLLVLMQMELRKVAMGVGLTYEQLTGDLSSVNFSSIRAGMVDLYRRVEQIQQLLFIEEAFNPLADMFQDFVSAWTGKDYSKAKIKWQIPKREWVDPLKDINADLAEMEGPLPLATWKQKIEERGLDFDEYLKELEESMNAIPENVRQIYTAYVNRGNQTNSDSGRDSTATTDGGKDSPQQSKTEEKK